MAGVYLHIPFCRKKCGYCDFFSRGGCAAETERYTAALCRQIRAFSEKHGRLHVSTVYFGGGTPSLTGAGNLCRILETVRESFAVEPDAEITLEANPGELCLQPFDNGNRGAEALRILRGAGFCRISMGVQSADDAELRLLGRRHTFAQAVQAVALAREAGFQNLSLDLMYGLPNQTMSRWERSVRKIMALKPEHISCYALHLEPGTPLYSAADRQPDDDTQADMYLTMVRMLEAAGWKQYEISNFARDGKISRHNSAYWTGEPYYGFGPGAHSLYGGRRLEYPPELEPWLRAGDGGPLPSPITEDGEAPDLAEEYLMLGLRTVRGICGSEFTERTGLPFEAVERTLEGFVPAGLVRRNGERMYLTPEGMLVSNALIVETLEALDEIRRQERI